MDGWNTTFLLGRPIFRRRGDRWPREILHISFFRLHAVQISVFRKRAQRFFGVGWGAMTCTVLAHMFDATQLHLHTCSMLRNCTCAHVRCYACIAHMFDATQLYLRTCSMLRMHCTHVRCYAIAFAHMFDATQLHLRTCSMLNALAHMFDATQLYLRTCSMRRNCTWAHVRCDAIVLAHMFDATQLHWRRGCMRRNAMYR